MGRISGAGHWAFGNPRTLGSRIVDVFGGVGWSFANDVEARGGRRFGEGVEAAL